MKHSSLLAPLVLLGACSAPTPSPSPEIAQGPADLGAYHWIDLTHPFSASTIYWPNNPTGFELDTQYAGVTPGGWYYSANKLSAPEHGGTHVDAPVHFAEQGQSMDEVGIDQLIGPACVIDVSASVGEDSDHLVSVAEVEVWEKEHGQIPPHSIVLFRTGWGRYYDDRVKCLGTAEHGEAAIPRLHFPGIDPDLAQWLVDERQPLAVGLDTPSTDRGQSTDFRTHRILAAKNICGLENVANLEQLPPTGAFVVALPMKIKGGTGAPLRIVAGVLL